MDAVRSTDARSPLALRGLDAFAAGLSGRAIRPEDPAYEVARQVWSEAADRRPAVIVRPADVPDVVRTVRYAREAGLPLAIRSGGHSIAGHGTADDAVVLDLAKLRGLQIDATRHEARAQTGLTTGQFTAATHAIGLATPFGDAGGVGLGGITLGGGIGWLVRKHGLTIDNLLAAELVTADGELVTASPTEHPDLFWAIRGGGGNFGVATRFHYRLQPAGTVFGGALFLPATRDVIRGLLDLATAAPDELTMIAMVAPAPPLPFLGPEVHGQLVVVAGFVWAGDLAAGEAALRPFRQLATPHADLLGPMPYPEILQLAAEGEQRQVSSTRSFFADELDDAALDGILDRLAESTSPMAFVQLRVLGGAMARVAPEATAFAHRARKLMIVAVAGATSPDGFAEQEAWTEQVRLDMARHAVGAYVNFLSDEGAVRVRDAYPAATLGRLAEIKRRYDPDNVFALNQNIRPAGATR